MVKQVIVMRKDLKNHKGKPVNIGKLCAQSSHACMKIFFDRFIETENSLEYRIVITEEMKQWKDGLFTKVCLGVDSEEELLDIYNKAEELGLPVALITDSGLTEFKGVHTNTCIAIGPDSADKIDTVTGHLKLLSKIEGM